LGFHQSPTCTRAARSSVCYAEGWQTLAPVAHFVNQILRITAGSIGYAELETLERRRAGVAVPCALRRHVRRHDRHSTRPRSDQIEVLIGIVFGLGALIGLVASDGSIPNKGGRITWLSSLFLTGFTSLVPVWYAINFVKRTRCWGEPPRRSSTRFSVSAIHEGPRHPWCQGGCGVSWRRVVGHIWDPRGLRAKRYPRATADREGSHTKLSLRPFAGAGPVVWLYLGTDAASWR